MKLVVDTNTLVSGYLWSGAPAQLVRLIHLGNAQLATNVEILNELRTVLARSKFAERLVAQGQSANSITARAAEVAIHVNVLGLAVPNELKDRADIIILDCAVAAEADLIVTGDGDLLRLKLFQGIPIVTANAAILRLKNDYS